ncbi:glycosyltransferase family 2 protein [Chryseobacterium wangxinyae]|uniref:glycosyltransferase family 2 protein n=1 Tax=Chryseobacterium sp. CY353 TaxID=2997334 RepID=UPI0022711320|nr:glycosyltransferase [Chryseobacterium sp. CY353]MCY0969059.1 glycosyltransferase [Chryseobacterium sp. CY353]
MRLSVCIPVFNFDVRELVYDLKKEIESKNIDAEIILIDDASEDQFKTINVELINSVSDFIFLKKNIGRSKIRNMFLQFAGGDYFLFLDCDVKIDEHNFLSIYLNEIEENSRVEVIYGNFKISPLFADTLRNRYSVEREIFAGNRTADFSVFKTVNFVIKADVFRRFSFEEELVDYGYEDYVFAKKMELSKVNFCAINNPVIHIDDTSNIVFLKKTDTAINSLLHLYRRRENYQCIKDIKVFMVAKRLKKLGLSKAFVFLYNLFERRIVKNLLSEHPNLRNLDLYKLGLLLKRMH